MTIRADFAELDSGGKLRVSVQDVVKGKVVGGSITTTSIPTDLINASDDTYNAMHMVFLNGPCAGTKTLISNYTGATRTLDVGNTQIMAQPGNDFEIYKPLDLSSGSAKLYYRINNGKRRERTMTLEDDSGGVVTYTFVGDELYAGTMTAEVQATTSGGAVYTSVVEIPLTVRKRIKDVRENP